jgi:hypothetical protein
MAAPIKSTASQATVGLKSMFAIMAALVVSASWTEGGGVLIKALTKDG